ncbi:hypothetical protein TYRP_016776 [Tyrophagus putrescentiae]|nr:hypothetical protein TYRP_016776 [Tyrophagus putrescentiae]
MLKAGVIWLIGTNGLGHNELASCVPSRWMMPINQMTPPSKPQMLKAGVIWLIGTDGLGHNELARCVSSRRTMPINQMTPVNA